MTCGPHLSSLKSMSRGREGGESSKEGRKEGGRELFPLPKAGLSLMHPEPVPWPWVIKSTLADWEQGAGGPRGWTDAQVSHETAVHARSCCPPAALPYPPVWWCGVPSRIPSWRLDPERFPGESSELLGHSPVRGPCPDSAVFCAPRPSGAPTRCHRPCWGHPRYRPGLLEATCPDDLWAVQRGQRVWLRRVCKRAEGEFRLGSHVGTAGD